MELILYATLRELIKIYNVLNIFRINIIYGINNKREKKMNYPNMHPSVSLKYNLHCYYGGC